MSEKKPACIIIYQIYIFNVEFFYKILNEMLASLQLMSQFTNYLYKMSQKS